MSKKNIEQRMKELQDDVKKILAILTFEFKLSSPDSQKMNQEEMMSAKEVADFLRMEVSTIIEKCHNGEIPHVKQGKSVKIKRLDLIVWMRKRKGSEEGSVEDYVNRYIHKHPLKG